MFTTMLSGEYYTHFIEEGTEAQVRLEWMHSYLWSPNCVSPTQDSEILVFRLPVFVVQDWDSHRSVAG